MPSSSSHHLLTTQTAAYIFAVAVYVAVTIPSLRTIVHPAEVDSREDRVEAMRILAAGNTIMMVVLATILILQVSLEPSSFSPLCTRTVVCLGHTLTRTLTNKQPFIRADKRMQLESSQTSWQRQMGLKRRRWAASTRKTNRSSYASLWDYQGSVIAVRTLGAQIC